MSGHTTGTLQVIEHSWAETSIYDQDGERRIALINIEPYATEETQEIFEVEARANATLFAHAWELLEAADSALNALIGCCIPAGGVDDSEAILSAQTQLRAAIAKATGAKS